MAGRDNHQRAAAALREITGPGRQHFWQRQEGKKTLLNARVHPGEGDLEPLIAELAKQNAAQHNIYFTPNEVSAEFFDLCANNKRRKNRSGKLVYALKPEKEDIARARAAYVDLDPPPDCAPGNYPDWRKTVLKGAGELAQEGKLPRWTVALNSGSGLQFFWRFAEPVGPDRFADAEQLNRDLAEALSALGSPADACHNIDRVMRLPHMINHPDEGKKKIGRSAALTDVMDRGGPIWAFDELRDATPRGKTLVRGRNNVGTASGGPVPAGGGDWSCPLPAAPATLSLEALGLDDADPLAAVIVTGQPLEVVQQASLTGQMLPEAEKGRRSETVLFVAAELWRRGVPPDRIAGALLNREWAISDHVYAQKEPERYAQRQVERARTYELEKALNATEGEDTGPLVPEVALEAMNAKHAVIEIDGTDCVVMSRVREEIGGNRRDKIAVQSFEALRKRYMNRRVLIGRDAKTDAPILVPLGKWWLEQPGRAQYLRVIFEPGGAPKIGRDYNLWQGFGIVPRAGDWSLMKAHIRDVLAGGDPESEAYILNWSAYAVQNLSGPQGVILTFRGGKGTGKGTFARALRDIFGQHGLQVASSALITGRFNGHLEDCCLLYADEALNPGDAEAESRLKAMTTEPTLAIEAKGRDARQAKNHLKIVMASNNEWVVPASWDERRYAVFDVVPPRATDWKAYFAALNAQMQNGGLEAMLADLLNRDLGDWTPWQAIPATDALMKQKALSLSPEEEWLLGVLEAGEIPGEKPENWLPDTRPSNWSLGRAEGGLYQTMRASSPRLRPASDRRLAMFLRDWLDNYKSGYGGQRGWRFPPLSDLRRRWEEKHGRREWPIPDAWAHEADFPDPEQRAQVQRDIPF